MSRFLCPLRVEYVLPWTFLNDGRWNDNDGTPRWQVIEPLQYYSSLLKRTVEVPTGFRFDGPSVPVVPLVYDTFGWRYTRSAGIHDKLCRDGRIDRKKADRVFLEAMRCENDEEIDAMQASGIDDDEIAERRAALEGRAQMMYAAVSLYTKSGLWRTDTHRPGYEPIG